MTDLDATAAGTRTCPACGAQNQADAAHCARCGADLTAGAGSAAPDAQRGDLELEEAWRAAAAEGYDTDFLAGRDQVSCTVCGSQLEPHPTSDRWWAVQDSASGRDDLVVVALRCPTCATAGRLELDGERAARFRTAVDEPEPRPEVDPSEVEWRHPPPAGSTPETPLGEDRRFFEPAEPGRLVEQRPLLDEQGEDIRQYTGEPVETEEGWVLPQQQNVGPGNEAGGGEWPDPATPSAMPKGDEHPG